MYNSENFKITLNTDSLININTGGTTSLVFTVSNTDAISTLYNLSFQLNLGDGMEIISSSIPYTSVSGNVYSFTNIKDIAPNEINYKITFTVKLNTEFSSGTVIPFETLIPCTLNASCDTMPRGNYDIGNEIIQATLSFSFQASKYVIYKINPPALLLGETYSSKIIIETAENSGISFDSFQDTLGNGVNYLGNMIITGYSSNELNNFIVIQPNNSNNSFKLLWSNVGIPENTKVTIEFDVKFNERYYVNGAATGSYIENSSSISNELSWSVEGVSLSYLYRFVAYEILLDLVVSKYVVDINEALTYSIYFNANLYHNLINLSGYLTTSDGQVLEDSSTPIMYTSKETSSAGVTQVYWNVGSVSAGSTAIININGKIASKYMSSGLNILAGDTFNDSVTCNAVSGATNKIITSSNFANLEINVPSVSKVITGYYYRDGTRKSFNTMAPGDYVSYKAVYNSTSINAHSNQVKLYDFYPYMTDNITGINYNYSSSQYPGDVVGPIDPYGVLWFISEIPGDQSFEIDYRTQIDYINNPSSFPYNLFKLQVVNSNGISFSSRSQVGFTLGKPNLILNKNVTGNNINKVKIGEIYSFTATLTNNNSTENATDAFGITFTEAIPQYVTLDSNSIVAKINHDIIPFTISGNLIIINIPNLAPNEVFTLNYQISINNTLGPNESFIFTSSTTAPYTQQYDSTSENLQYDVGALTANSTLTSESIFVQISSDTPTKIVGDTVYYTLSITFPMGQRLSSFSGSILIPLLETYSNRAWLNNDPITANFSNSSVTFPAINNIDTTLNSVVYSYRIECLVSNSIVSNQNPLYTIENYYGNVSYVNMLNVTTNLGIANYITINHPYINLNISSSNIMNGFVSPFIVGTSNIIYTNILASNAGSTPANNTKIAIKLPTYLNFNSVQTSSLGVTSSYNNQTNTLLITIDTINASSNKYLIFKSNISSGVIAESKLIITGSVNQYYNDVSLTKVYTSNIIYNNELYINSLVKFLPLSFYRLIGSEAAINLSAPGAPTKIEYIITNTGQGYDSYNLNMTPIAIPYDVYIGSTFIQSIVPNTSPTITSPLLNNINPLNSVYITFNYTLPSGDEYPLYYTMLVTCTSLNNPNTNKLIPTTLQDP
ncbi:hypothetical protein [Clostridium sp.]|uniref:hypothetical protein n=1 Tax=Clostridium sp. TaxID=1506 RepID=UPI0034638E6C